MRMPCARPDTVELEEVFFPTNGRLDNLCCEGKCLKRLRQAFTTAATACEGAGRSEFGPELSQLGEMRKVGNTRYKSFVLKIVGYVLQNKEKKTTQRKQGPRPQRVFVNVFVSRQAPRTGRL